MFDIHQAAFDEDEEFDSERVADYVDGLMEEFANSPEAQPIIEKYGMVHYAGMLMGYGFDFLGVSPAKMTLSKFNEVLFDLIPRKVSTEPENAPAIIEELKAFWSFVYRQYGLPNARKILESLDRGAAERLQNELANPANWGMAKSFFMGGTAAGYNMTKQEDTDKFLLEYNARLQRQPGLGFPEELPPVDLLLDGDDYDDDDELLPLAPPPTKEQKKAKKKKRKEQRKARKRNRK